MKCLIALLLIFNFTALLVAQEANLVDKPGKKIKLVRSYKNDADYIAESSSNTARVEELGDRFVFLDDKGLKIAEKQKEKGKIVRSMDFTPGEKENFKQHKGVTKPTVDYKIIGDGAFLMETHQETSFNSENDASRAEDVKRMLYDNTGKKILDFPEWMNFVLVAPDKKHFLGYYDGEVDAEKIYFYDATGVLLKTRELPRGDYGWGVHFSPNGQFILLFNNFIGKSGTFDVLNSQGDILWSHKTGEGTSCNSGYGCVSNSGELVACLSAGFSIIKKGKMFSNKNLSVGTHGCEFTDNEQGILLYVGKKGKRALKSISINGDELDSLELGNVIEMKGMGADKIIIKSTGGINEYLYVF